MGIKEVTNAIKRFVNKRKALIEVSVGPSLPHTIHLDDDTIAYPLGSLGNKQNIDFGIRFLNSIGIPTDQGFVDTASHEGAPFNGLTAIVYAGLEHLEYKKATQGESKKIDRYRSLLGLYLSDNLTPILRIQWTEPKLALAEFIAPPHRGIRNRAPDDPISQDFLRTCATQQYNSDQLHYFIGMLNQIYEIKDYEFKIARYYSLLEAMSGAITSQFKQIDNNIGTRTAIRFMTGYFVESDIPRFTIMPDTDFEFDHIELAGRIRDKLFHGGGELIRESVPANLRPGIDLLSIRPDMITHWLRRDCEREIVGWSCQVSRAWQAQHGTNFTLPPCNPNYNGRELTKPLISGSRQKNTAIGSVYTKVTGENIGILRLHISD